MYQCYINFTNR